MIRKIATAFALMLLTAFTLPADFSYQQTSTITGGMIASVMKVAGVFSKSATEPIRTTVSVKGDRMMHRGPNDASVIDLGAQTITRIDFQKKTYSVMTFAEMKAAMEQAAQKAQQKNKQGDTQQMDFKVSVDSTGKTRQIGGVEAREMLMKMEMQGTDQNSGQTGGMTMNADMWIVPGVAGYEEVRDFNRRMAEKLDWNPSGSMFMANNPGVSQGMAGMAKEMAKLEGVPVLQLTTMMAAGQPAGGSGQGGAQQQQQQQQQQPAAERPSLGGVLGGKLGLGGLGRKKQDTQQTSDASSDKAPSTPGSLLEMTTELSGFASAPVDASQFEVPAGFKKVEADRKR